MPQYTEDDTAYAIIDVTNGKSIDMKSCFVMPNRYIAPEGRPMLTGSVIQEVNESISGPRRLLLRRRLHKELWNWKDRNQEPVN
jgi:hypothetical protein